jgi:hypothetical protein
MSDIIAIISDNPEILEKEAKNIMQKLNEAYNQNDFKKFLKY